MSSNPYKIIEATLARNGEACAIERLQSGKNGKGNATVYMAGGKFYAVSKLVPGMALNWSRHTDQRFSHTKTLWVADALGDKT